MQKILNFDIAVEPAGEGYRARVVDSPAGEAAADFVFPFTDKDLEILILKVAGSVSRARRRTRRIQTDERRLLEDFGQQLFQAVFSGPAGECLRRSRRAAASRGAGLRVRLRLPPALANIPWEYLYDAEYGFVGLSPESALVRYVATADPMPPFPVSPPLRILAMISAPSDVPELQGEEEWGKLNAALGDLAGRGMVQVDRLEAGTLAALQRPLRHTDYHVLHFVGHGVYDNTAQDGALALEGPDGKARLVTGRDLGMMLRGHRSLRMIVLNACEGARGAPDDPLGGVAQALVRQGIPAVIAMQFEISDPAALVFSSSFYEAIADRLPVDLAMVEARKTMFAEGHEVEWATPVLYLRTLDGRVFIKDPIPSTDHKTQQDTDQKTTQEPDRRAKKHADRRAREEANRRAREEADRQAKADAQRRAQEDADRQAQEEADRQAQEEADRQAQDLATRYTLACAAADAGDWDQALATFTMIADVDPGYRDVRERAEHARKQQLITRLTAEARQLHQARQWAAVVKVGQRLQALDPAAADPEGLVASARAELAADQATGQLDADYQTAQRLLNAGDWQQAIQVLERITEVNPAYRATPALLQQARRNLTDTAAHDAPAAPSRSQTTALVPPSHLTRTLTGHTDVVYCVAFSPDGRLLATSSGDKTARLWDPATGNCLRTLTGHDTREWKVAFSPDGRVLATAGRDDRTVPLWDPATGKLRRTLTDAGDIVDVAFSPDGRLLATVGGWGIVQLWDLARGKCLRTLTGHKATLTCVAFSPDGRLLATAGDWDGTVRLWDPATGKCLRILAGHDDPVSGVAFSPDGRLLATSASADNTPRLWDPATGKCLRTLTGHTRGVLTELLQDGDEGVWQVAFSPDGRLLATAGNDATARLWDPATGKCLHTLTGHTNLVSGVAFSPGGRLLATVGWDATARLWG